MHWQDNLAESVGVDARKYRTLAFATASFFGGLSGALPAHYVGTVNPDSFDVAEMVYVLTWAIVEEISRRGVPVVLVEQDAAADDTYREALRVRSGHGLWILAMPIERRARSSLFHMRMEARHREQYEATARERLRRFAQETRKAIADLAAGGAPPLRGYERWRAEKPAIFGETRKFLAACLLLVSRPS